MATSMAAASDILKIVVDGKAVELSVTTRQGESALIASHPDVPADDRMQQMVARTILNWVNVYRAVTQDTWALPDGVMSACKRVGLERSAGEPFVTVWNKDWNGLSITVHSWDNGYAAMDTVAQHQAGVELFKAGAEKFGVRIAGGNPANQPTAPANVTQMPQQTATTGSATLKPFVRSTQAPFKVSGQVIPNTVGIERGQTKSPNWNTPALLAQSYSKDAVEFDKGQIVLYRLSDADGNVSVREYNDKMLLSFRLIDGDDIAVWEREDTQYEGKTIKSDWSEALSKLGLEFVQPGQTFTLNADYIALKASAPTTNRNGESVQYKNFYGFFNAPEQPQPMAKAAGEDEPFAGLYGAADADERPAWLDNPAQPDVGDGENIPF